MWLPKKISQILSIFFLFFLNMVSTIYRNVDFFKINIEEIKKKDKFSMKKLEAVIKRSDIVTPTILLIYTLISNNLFGNIWWSLTFTILLEVVPNWLINFFNGKIKYSDYLLNKFFLNFAYFLATFSPLRILLMLPESNQNNKIFHYSEEDLITLVNNLTSKEILLLEPKEAQLVNLAFKLDDIDIKKITIPNEETVFLNIEMETREVKKAFIENKVTKYPVLDKNYRCVGIFDIKNFIVNQEKIENGLTWKNFINKNVLFIESSTKISDALEVLRKSETHFSIVKENGKEIGIITLKNVLSSLIGKINDEKI